MWVVLMLSGLVRDRSKRQGDQSLETPVRSSHFLQTIPAIVFAFLVIDAHGQEPAALPTGARTAEARIDALIPVSDTDPADVTSPVVYVRRSALAIEAADFGSMEELPPELIRRAEYHLDLVRDELQVEMHFEVLRKLSSERNARLFLPLRSIIVPSDADACLVDGRPARVIPCPG